MPDAWQLLPLVWIAAFLAWAVFSLRHANRLAPGTRATHRFRAFTWTAAVLLFLSNPLLQFRLHDHACDELYSVVNAHIGRPMAELEQRLGPPVPTWPTPHYPVQAWYAPLPGGLRVDLVVGEDDRLVYAVVND